VSGQSLIYSLDGRERKKGEERRRANCRMESKREKETIKATLLKKDKESQRKERQRKWDVTQVCIVHK
jgi:hypothetical protein